MTPVIAGSINRTPTGPHLRCDMFFFYLILDKRYFFQPEPKCLKKVSPGAKIKKEDVYRE